MYLRTETVTSLSGNFIPFVDTLTVEEKSIFLNAINDSLASSAIFYNVDINETTLVSTSCWESKDQYLISSTQTDNIIRAALNQKCSSDYYNDTTKFTIEVVEEML